MTLPRSARWVACTGLLFAILSTAAPAADAPKWDPARTTNPEDVAELKALQAAVNGVVEKCAPATVALKYGSGSGSVIVSEDGLILTAAHVIRDYPENWKGKYDPPPLPFVTGKKLHVMLPDGEEVEAKTLGINQGMDSGMVKITSKPKGDKYYHDGKWVFCPVGKSGDVKKQQWVVALGHPDGPKEGRSPVARLGRVYVNSSGFLRTDCTIVGGDSGGPLFNLNGEVIGIHSRMVFPFTLAHNIHVPTDDFKTDGQWEKLLAGEWIDAPGGYFGVVFPKDDKEDAWLTEVEKNGPAEKAGLKPGDTIMKFNNTVIRSVKEFRQQMEKARSGEKVKITARRSTEILEVTVTLTKRP